MKKKIMMRKNLEKKKVSRKIKNEMTYLRTKKTLMKKSLVKENLQEGKGGKK